LFDKLKYQDERNLVLYHAPDLSCIELVNGREGLMLVNALSKEKRAKIDFHTKNHIIHRKRNTEIFKFSDIWTNIPVKYYKGLLLMVWESRSIGILTERSGYEKAILVPFDFLIIANNALKPDELNMLNINAKHVIWDSSNDVHVIERNPNQVYKSSHQVRLHGFFNKSLQ
jgi:hypothetical protein